MLIEEKQIQNAFPSNRWGFLFQLFILFGFQEKGIKEKMDCQKTNLMKGYDAVGKVPLVCLLEIKCIEH